MRTTFKFIPVTLLLVACLTNFPMRNASAMDLDPCVNTWLGCVGNCSDDDTPCHQTCWDALNSCIKGECPSCPYNVAFNANIINSYSFQVSNGIASSQVLGLGFYFLATNGAGAIQPLQIAVGAWNGSNYGMASTVTNVQIYTIPVSILSGFGPANYDQAPWTTIGQPVQNTGTGLWETTWTPTNYTASVIVADAYDSARGLLSSATLVLPQPSQPYMTTHTVAASGAFSFTIFGPVGGNTTVQVSSDLNAWNNLVTITNFNGAAEFGISVTNKNNRMSFYRALVN